MTPLADQQLAGLIMWVPAGGLYLLGALALLRRWIEPPRQAWPAATGAGPAATGAGPDTMAAGSDGRRPRGERPSDDFGDRPARGADEQCFADGKQREPERPASPRRQ